MKIFRSRKGFNWWVIIGALLALLVGYVALAMFFPQFFEGMSQAFSLVKQCPRPSYTMDEYITDVNESYRILGGFIAMPSQDDEFIAIRIDADEFALGIDQQMFACYNEEHINDSELERYDDILFGPPQSNQPPRKMETIYRDYVSGLAEHCEPGTMGDIKMYVKLYKSRFGRDGEFYSTIGGYVDVYKDCMNIEHATEELQESSTINNLERVFEFVRRELDNTEEVSDPEFIYRTHNQAREALFIFLYGTDTIDYLTLGERDLRRNISSADLNTALGEYARILNKYVDSMFSALRYIERQGDSPQERAVNQKTVSDMKWNTNYDLVRASLVSLSLWNNGKEQAYNSFCTQARQIDNTKLQYFNRTDTCQTAATPVAEGEEPYWIDELRANLTSMKAEIQAATAESDPDEIGEIFMNCWYETEAFIFEADATVNLREREFTPIPEETTDDELLEAAELFGEIIPVYVAAMHRISSASESGSDRATESRNAGIRAIRMGLQLGGLLHYSGKSVAFEGLCSRANSIGSDVMDYYDLETVCWEPEQYDQLCEGTCVPSEGQCTGTIDTEKTCWNADATGVDDARPICCASS